ncbi:MAG: tagaturonate reductase, partial [Lachnospiraceae bacterium]|nr:tagaturonate reductase [Lachnospiraceae bacterium]
ELMSIALNSTTKFKARLLPAYNDYRRKFGKSPKYILFSLASLIVFYRGKRGEEEIALADAPEYLEFFRGLWEAGKDYTAMAQCMLANEMLWGQNLAVDENVVFVAEYIERMVKDGERAALKAFLTL